jgi:hypothetical protein
MKGNLSNPNLERIILVSKFDREDQVQIPFQKVKEYQENHDRNTLIWDLLEDMPNDHRATATIEVDLTHLGDIRDYFENKGAWNANAKTRYLKRGDLAQVSAYLDVDHRVLLALQKKRKINRKRAVAKEEEEVEEDEWNSEEEQMKRELEEARIAGDIEISEEEEDDERYDWRDD